MTAIFATSVAVIMLVVCGGLYTYTRRAAERNAENLMRSAADRMERDLSLEGPQAEFADELHDLKVDDLAMLIVDRKGNVLRRTEEDGPSWPTIAQAGWRTVSKPVGAYTVVIGTRWSKTAASLKNLATVLSIVAVCVVLVTAVGAWLLVGRTLSPIGSLARQAKTASAESMQVRLTPSSQDAEVVGLVSTLNGLLERLAETAAIRGRFYAAASHELRTPLQALSGHLDVALTKERSADEYRMTVAEAFDQTKRLRLLVQDLLILNQLDVATTQPPSEPVALADVCDQAISSFRRAISEKHLHVLANLTDDLELIAPPTHLEMLVRNLIENAVKYTPPGGNICLQLHRSPGSVEMELWNECVPPPADMLPRLFEPFYRPDGSRSSEEGGNGLGLAICRATAVANGWDIAIPPTPDGFRVVVGFTRPATANLRDIP